MATNSVSTYQGSIEWIGEVREGKSKNGRSWTSVDFVVKYNDRKEEIRRVLLNVFGEDLVDSVIERGVGSTVRVTCAPNARKGSDGRWWGSLSVIDVGDPKTKRDDDEHETRSGGDLPF